MYCEPIKCAISGRWKFQQFVGGARRQPSILAIAELRF
jgi:hypothetical protein